MSEEKKYKVTISSATIIPAKNEEEAKERAKDLWDIAPGIITSIDCKEVVDHEVTGKSEDMYKKAWNMLREQLVSEINKEEERNGLSDYSSVLHETLGIMDCIDYDIEKGRIK